MSTRVHELAKELGLKSQELLELIQESGLEVKASPLASLDVDQVARIRALASRGEATAPRPEPAASDERSPEPSTRVTPAPTPSPQPAPTSPVAATPAPARPATPPATETPPAPPQAPAASLGTRPSETRPISSTATPAPPRPTEATATPEPAPAPPTPAPTPTTTPPPAAARPTAPSPSPVLSRPPQSSPPAGGSRPGGPLSGHGHGHGRPQGPGGGAPLHRPGGGNVSGRPAAPSSPAQGRPADSASSATPPSSPAPPTGTGTQPAAPLRPSDYISPTGTRMSNRPPMGSPPPIRRPSQGPRPGGGTEPPRRDSGGPPRSAGPLPRVATPTGNVPPRRPEGPRPSEPAGSTQRPDKKFTPEQIRAMMQGRQIPGVGGTAIPPRPGGAPAGGPQGRRTDGPPPRLGNLPMPGPVGGTAPIHPPSINDADDDDRKKRPGGSADRAGRRAKRAERATERSRVTSPVDARTIIEGEDETQRGRRLHRHKAMARGATIAPRKTRAEVEPPVTVRSLSEAIGIKANDLMRKLMGMGQLVTINTTLDDETAQMLALEFGVELDVVHERTAEDDMLALIEGPAEETDTSTLPFRPPVITILGHVDHGKTSLLDKIRSANVVASESGGITQHIGAYQVEHNGKKITFVDTPGHEAFTAMRARGANVTDIVVLVVAADDGVMPQTQEAIAHAKAAEVPVVVALNKIDLPNVDTPANISKIYGELSQQGLIPEEYGGDVPVVRTSATAGKGIDDLLETLEVLAELHELRANPDRPATGTCLEASLSEGRGVVATVLVQDGTLKVGDVLVCGDGFGRVRALFNDKGQPVQEAGPSTPVEISGLDEVPTAGEKFAVMDDITRAREIAETRRGRTRAAAVTERQTITLENLFGKLAEMKVQNLNLILKADVQGSLEALTKELEKIQNEEVPVRILLKGVGGITESDVILADASQAIIIGFRVAPEDRAISLAEEKDIEIRRYDIIYQVTDEIKKAVEGMLVPETKEVHLGRAVVRQAFRISKVGTVAGCIVTQGTVERSGKARLIREGREIYKGAIETLKRIKDDVKEVREGYECGIKIANFDDIKVDDIIEVYRIDTIRRTL